MEPFTPSEQLVAGGPKPSRANYARCSTTTCRLTHRPVREPVFNEILQLGIAVRDLAATMRRYVDDYGIGPWQVYEFNAGKAEDFREYGQPVERSRRLAVATVGQVQWELIEPLDDVGVYARFLAEKGEGVHHVAVPTPDFDETVAQADRGNGVILSREFDGARVAYLGTDRDLGGSSRSSAAPGPTARSRTRAAPDARTNDG